MALDRDGCKFEPRCDFATTACRATPRRVAPLHPYTEMLLEAAPGLRKDHYISRPPAFPASRAMHGVGCPLAGRCPCQIGNLCAEARPPVQVTKNGYTLPSDCRRAGTPYRSGQNAQPSAWRPRRIATLRRGLNQSNLASHFRRARKGSRPC